MPRRIVAAGSRAAHRPRRRLALLVLALPVVLAPMLTRGEPVRAGTPSPPAAVAVAPDVRSLHIAPAAAPPAEPAREPVALFAAFEGVEFAVPSEELRVVGFHEASFPNALAMHPVGHLESNDNTTKFAPPADAEGSDYVVLSSRGRPHAATSAVDLALPVGAPVASVVSGTVRLVEPYHLYGQYHDTRVEIVPDARPDLVVVMIHVSDVRVSAGDRVVAGETVVAGSSTLFPFSSHVDRYLDGDRGPHVHVEIKVPLPEPVA